MIHKGLIRALFFVTIISPPVYAGVIPPQINSGAFLQEMSPQPTPAPNFSPVVPKIQTFRHTKNGGITFLVKGFRFVGNTRITTKKLKKIVAPYQNKYMGIDQLRDVAEKITKYYRKKGYFLDKAVVEAQEVKNGIVSIRIHEAKWDMPYCHDSRISSKQDHNNRKNCPKGWTEIFKAMDRNTPDGGAVTIRDIDHTIMLVDILTGGKTSVIVMPGQKNDTSTAEYDLTSKATFTGSAIQMDNWGSLYTGAERITLSPTLNNIMTLGDKLSLIGNFSGNIQNFAQGPGMEYSKLEYVTPINSYGTKAGLSFTALNYNVLGATVPAYGHAYILNAKVSHPVLLHTDYSMYIQLDGDYYILDDLLGGSSGINDYRTIPATVLAIYGRNNFKSTSSPSTFDNFFTYNVSATTGSVDFENASAQAADATTLKTGGFFYKINIQATDTQILPGDHYKNYLTINASGQLASKNLDPSQQIIIGGPTSIAAYTEGQFNGSQGGYGQLTLNHMVIPPSQKNIGLNLDSFISAGYINVDRFVLTQGPNSSFLYGPGVGANITKGKNLSVSLSVSTPLGAQPLLVSSSMPGTFDLNSGGNIPVQIWGQMSYVLP